jgi:hypothetical protein
MEAAYSDIMEPADPSLVRSLAAAMQRLASVSPHHGMAVKDCADFLGARHGHTTMDIVVAAYVLNSGVVLKNYEEETLTPFYEALGK